MVDYVNDPIDLRLQSVVPDGVPDHLVEAIARKLVIFVKQQINSPFLP